MGRVKTFDKDEVLNKAIDLFWTKGYNATSMQDLVTTLGINRSSMYDTYGDKRQLFITALTDYHTKAADGMIDMISSAKSYQELLDKMFGITVKECTGPEGKKGCFATNTMVELVPHDEEIAEVVKQNMSRIEDAVTKAIAKAQKNKETSNQDPPRALARFMLNTITGLRILAKSDHPKKQYDDIVGVAMSVLK